MTGKAGMGGSWQPAAFLNPRKHLLDTVNVGVFRQYQLLPLKRHFSSALRVGKQFLAGTAEFPGGPKGANDLLQGFIESRRPLRNKTGAGGQCLPNTIT